MGNVCSQKKRAFPDEFERLREQDNGDHDDDDIIELVIDSGKEKVDKSTKKTGYGRGHGKFNKSAYNKYEPSTVVSRVTYTLSYKIAVYKQCQQIRFSQFLQCGNVTCYFLQSASTNSFGWFTAIGASLDMESGSVRGSTGVRRFYFVSLGY